MFPMGACRRSEGRNVFDFGKDEHLAVAVDPIGSCSLKSAHLLRGIGDLPGPGHRTQNIVPGVVPQAHLAPATLVVGAAV